MIFVIVGSQRFQFNRLLEKIDDLVNKGVIHEREIFAQIGHSSYLPKHYSYMHFIDTKRYLELINKSELIITHGGASAIISSLKLNKKVISVPRLAKYNEHVDDHQKEIVNQLRSLNLIYGIDDVNELENALENINDHKFDVPTFSNKLLVDVVEEDLSTCECRLKVGFLKKIVRFFGGG